MKYKQSRGWTKTTLSLPLTIECKVTINTAHRSITPRKYNIMEEDTGKRNIMIKIIADVKDVHDEI